MHSVIKHLLARRGKSVPVADGRKIVLVLYGGIMRGVRGGGALVALEELGLGKAFDDVYTYSIGFPNASFFLSGQIKQGIKTYLKELSGDAFIKKRFISKTVDIDFFMELIRNKHPIDLEAIQNQSTKLFVRVVNAKTKERLYKEVHETPRDDYQTLLEASVSPPVLGHGPVKVGNQYLFDTNIIAYLKEFTGHVMATDATDILVIYNSYYQKVRGFKNSDRVLPISVDKKWKMSRFETDPVKLRAACLQMGRRVKESFGQNSDISL